MKTLKEFDYDLWAIEENGRKRYFARIKATGEETEVSLEVMRLLLRQEKQMRREYAKQQTIGPVLSLDAIRDGGSMALPLPCRLPPSKRSGSASTPRCSRQNSQTHSAKR